MNLTRHFSASQRCKRPGKPSYVADCKRGCPQLFCVRSKRPEVRILGRTTSSQPISFASSGESVGEVRASASHRGEETPELSAGGVERSLLILSAVVKQRTAELDHPGKDSLHGFLS